MHRPNGMTDASTTSVVGAVQYGPANELLGLNSFGNYESRTYNAMLQMTDLKIGNFAGGANLMNLNYTFSATQNNGKITMQKDNLSGEEVQYTYDTLNRLIAAGTTAASEQAGVAPSGQSYGFDGFGNLTSGSTVIDARQGFIDLNGDPNLDSGGIPHSCTK